MKSELFKPNSFMKKKSLLILILFISLTIHSQNIFDIEHSEIYADHLFQIEDFKEAAFEYERLIQKVPGSILYKERLLLSYRFSGQILQGIQRTEDFFHDEVTNYPEKIIDNYILLLILVNDFEKCELVLSKKLNLNEEKQNEYRMAYYLLTKQYGPASDFILLPDELKTGKSKKYNELLKVYYETSNIQYKKPTAALILSVIIPGSGKAYANDFNNGALVFSVIGLYAWQSYRAFSNDGVKSFYGWVFGALASGFYIGNIYGSYQSAKRENNYQDELIKEKVKNIILKLD